jgi:Type I phosphodiesterase / nucleotide pyrophosphatase
MATWQQRGRPAIATLVLAAGACAAGPSSTRPTWPATTAATAPAPRLLVTIVVDQLAAWIAAERWPELPADGGFARLRREGLTVRALRYQHAATDTAPGHSALYTGAVPRVSGIIGNDLIRADGRAVSMLEDPRTRLVVAGRAAPLDRSGSSLAALAVGVETLADVLAARDPQAAIFSFSLKDRGALFAAGRRPTLALWLDPAEGAFVSSTAFTAVIPDWVAPIAGPDAVRAARASPWQPLDAGWIAAHATTRDDQPGEGDYAGLGRTFPHPIESTQALRATPVGDDLLFALARAAIAHAAPAPHPTLLALSLSSNDYIGHIFGPDSWEAWDQLRRLDRGLAQLLTFLDDAVGRDAYAVMLSGDHGIGALPELEGLARAGACRRSAPLSDDPRDGATPPDCPSGARILQDQVIAVLEETARRVLGGDPGPPWIAGLADPWVFFSARGAALDGAARARLTQAAALALRPHGIAEVIDARAATAPCGPDADQSRAALVCRSLPPPTGAAATGPDLYLLVEPRSFFDARYVPGHGVHHGSPYLYDRTVPLLVRAPGRIAAGRVREAPLAFTAFARTAAALLGLPPPAAAGPGEDLTITARP